MIDYDLYYEELKDVIEDVITTQIGDYKKTYKGYNFRGPICGDSHKRWKSGRGHMLLNKQPYMYVCFNGGCEANEGMSAVKFLKNYYPVYFKEYLHKVFEAHNEDEAAKKKRKEKAIKNLYTVKRNLPEKDGRVILYDLNKFANDNLFRLKYFRPLIQYKEAIEWCENRKIPQHIYSKWLFIDNVNGKPMKRVVIPFTTKDKKMYFFQARSIINEEPKYINAITELKPVFNYYHFDNNKPTIIVEGPIDSLFLENSIAVLGLNYNEEALSKVKQRYFIFDNDEAGKDAAMKHLKKGEYVFAWKIFLKDKGLMYNNSKIDFNDLSIKFDKSLWTFDELKKYFVNSLMQSAFI